jgi:CelD/BcsL family acetyltransferase involved in cellulose biosynthesis
MSTGNPTQEFTTQLMVDNIVHELNIFDTLEDILTLKKEWLNLENECDDAFSCYQGFSWCFEYYKNYANDLNNRHSPMPQVITVHRNNCLIMVWPLMKIQTRTGLTLLTTATDPLCQFSNILYDKKHFTEDVGKTVLEHLKKTAACDAISLNNVPSQSILTTAIGEQGIKENSKQQTALLVVKDQNVLNDLESARKKLETYGKVSYTLHEAGSEHFNSLMKKLLELKTQALKSSGAKPGLLDEQATSTMFANLNSTDFFGACLHVLSIDEKPVSIEFGIHSNGKYHSYLDATEMDWAKQEPCRLLLAFIVAWAEKEKINQIDFGLDAPHYKKTLSSEGQILQSCNIPLTASGYLYSKLWKANIRPLLKSLLRSD